MEKKNEFKIPGFIETGDVSATPLTDGTELDLQMARKDLMPYDAIHHEALGFAVEAPKPPQTNLFERIGETAVAKIQLNGEKMVEMRVAEAAGTEVEALTVSTVALQRNLDEKQFGLAA